MKAGRELDALVAEKVMGWLTAEDSFNPGTYAGWMPAYNEKMGHGHYERPTTIPEYSTSIDAAWEVVEKLAGCFTLETDHAIPPEWQVHWATPRGSFHVLGKTAPHAICLAALRAVGHNVD